MFKGLEGVKKIADLVDGLRNDPPRSAGDLTVKKVEDYTSDEMRRAGFGYSNMLRFIFDDESWIAVRPSGTEPKCKFYLCVRGKDHKEAEQKLSAIREVFEKNS